MNCLGLAHDAINAARQFKSNDVLCTVLGHPFRVDAIVIDLGPDRKPQQRAVDGVAQIGR
jgi:hypothetical protein